MRNSWLLLWCDGCFTHCLGCLSWLGILAHSGMSPLPVIRVLRACLPVTRLQQLQLGCVVCLHSAVTVGCG